jgi:hypothetical protein
MAQNTTLFLPAQQWTLLTDSNVTSVTFQNKGNQLIFIAGTSDTTPPENTDGALLYRDGFGEANIKMADLFPGIPAQRLWAFSKAKGFVMVSHA